MYAKIAITDKLGVPQGLDVHWKLVTADNDQISGGDQFNLISDG